MTSQTEGIVQFLLLLDGPRASQLDYNRIISMLGMGQLLSVGQSVER